MKIDYTFKPCMSVVLHKGGSADPDKTLQNATSSFKGFFYLK